MPLDESFLKSVSDTDLKQPKKGITLAIIISLLSIIIDVTLVCIYRHLVFIIEHQPEPRKI